VPLQWSVARAVGFQFRHLGCIELVVLAHESKAKRLGLERLCRSSRSECVVEHMPAEMIVERRQGVSVAAPRKLRTVSG
jgi:hypothetical protein